MGSTSFLGVFLPKPASCFSEPVIFLNLYHMFLASVGLSLGLFYFHLFFCTLFWVKLVTTEIIFSALKSKREKGTG